jgi:hypothetical protein
LAAEPAFACVVLFILASRFLHVVENPIKLIGEFFYLGEIELVQNGIDSVAVFVGEFVHGSLKDH